jgi:LPXTG-site transpeptidase (sortase) family protein
VRDLSLAGYVLRAALLSLAVIALGLVFYLTILSALVHTTRQALQFSRFRSELAAGTAPTGQMDQSGRHLLALSTPVALLDIPSLGVHEVVAEGTTPEVLTLGPGHRRDTPLPGQPGTSVIMGRQAAFGGPFRHIHALRRGATIKVTIGFGNNVATFRVIDVRHPGNPRPPLLHSGAARLTLVTASGTPFAPSGLVYVDADLASAVEPASPVVISSPSQLGAAEAANASDTSTVWALILWLEALLMVALGAVWSWHRWGHRQTWMVFVPVTLLVAYYVSDQITRLLPNLL